MKLFQKIKNIKFEVLINNKKIQEYEVAGYLERGVIAVREISTVN